MSVKDEMKERMNEAEKRAKNLEAKKKELEDAKADFEELSKQASKDKNDAMEDTHDLKTSVGNLEKKQIDDMALVKGTFIYPRGNGVYKALLRKWKGEPLKWETFVDGKEYTIPLWKARWLNGDEDECGCADIQHKHIQGPHNVQGYYLEGNHKLTVPDGQAAIKTERQRKPVFKFFITERAA